MAAMPKTKDDLKRALPDIGATLRLKGLDAAIEVYRDGFGIPHVRAQTVHDAFFGQGFVTAQDRLWHMDYDRRRAYGRWAEFAGKGALEQDKTMRRFQIAPTVRRDYEAVNSETRAMMDAYAAGVNAFIETTEALPVEYELVGGRPEQWQPWDCMAVFKVRHILMGVFEGKLWRARLVNALGPEKAARLLKGYQPGHLVIVPPGKTYEGPWMDGLEELRKGMDAIAWMKDSPEDGSNSWAVSGRRTASGKPLLAGDPHRGLDTPNVYYQNHIACPEFDAIGLSFPGFPGFPHFGHNAHIAWCVTHAQADYQDLYIERFKHGDPTSYEFKGQRKRAEVRREVISVRGGQPVEMDVVVTQHGPIIGGNPASGYGIAFKYTATAETNLGFQCILPMLRAKDADDMDAAMKDWVDPCNNFMFADTQGNIQYLNRGKVPIRPMANAWLPAPGWTGQYEWQGFIPFDKLARSRNPNMGFIVTANNRIVDESYPYYITLNYAPEYRARRISERLKPLTKAAVEDMSAIHSERISIPAQVYTKLLAQVEPLDDASARARDMLTRWDGSIERDAVTPTIYSAFRLKLLRMIVEPLVGQALAKEMFEGTGRGAPGHLRQLASQLTTMAQEGDTSLLPPGSNWKSLMAKALSEGVAYLKERLGEDMSQWQWGGVHHTRPRHTLSEAFPELAPLLDPPSVAMGGDIDTPQAGSYSLGAPFAMNSMSVARYIFDTADWDNSRWVVPLGSSGHPGSPHYADQAPIWAEVDVLPMTYSWDKVRASAKSQQRLEKG